MVRLLDRVAWVCATGALWVSAGLLCYMVGHILIEIVARSAFATSTYSMDEFVGYAIGAMTFLSLAHTFRERKHIRVGILQNFVRGRMAVLVEVVCIAATFAITLFIARYIFRTLARDWERGTVSPTLTETPIWIIDGAIFLGLCLFLLQLLASAAMAVAVGVEDDKGFGD